MEGVTTTVSTILTDVGTFFTQSITWLGEVMDEVVASPVLLIMVVAMPVCGFAVGLLKRIKRL